MDSRLIYSVQAAVSLVSLHDEWVTAVSCEGSDEDRRISSSWRGHHLDQCSLACCTVNPLLYTLVVIQHLPIAT